MDCLRRRILAMVPPYQSIADIAARSRSNMSTPTLRHAGELLACGRITDREYAAVQDIIEVFNRMHSFLCRVYAGAFDFTTLKFLMVDDVKLARDALKEFRRDYHQVGEPCRAFVRSEKVFHTQNPDDCRTIERLHEQFRPDIERLDSIALLFKLVEEHWQDHVYHPYRHELHRRPSARLWQLQEIFDPITLIAADLYNVACESRQWAYKADLKCKNFKYIMRKIHEVLAREKELEQKAHEDDSSSSDEERTLPKVTADEVTGKEEHAVDTQKLLLASDVAQPDVETTVKTPCLPIPGDVQEIDQDEHSFAAGEDKSMKMTKSPSSHNHIADAEDSLEGKTRKIGRSFSAVEEAVHHRGHTRAVTENPPNYSILAQEADKGALGQPRFGSVIRRNAHHVPRIFTRSFSELEDSVRKLRLAAFELPPIPQFTLPRVAGIQSAAVTNAHTSPLMSVPPSPTIPPSPATLQRREALLERDVAFQDRIINGDVIRSRRPSDRLLSNPTLSDRTSAQQIDALDQWLNEEKKSMPAQPDKRGKKHTL